MAKLSSKERKALPPSDYVFPAKAPGAGSYPIPDRSHAVDALARAAGKPEEAAARRAVKRKFPAIKVKKAMREIELAKSAEVSITVPLWKDDAKRVVYGVVLTPGLKDSQGDIVGAEDIERAAHRFLTAYRKHDVQHNEQAAGVETVESFIAPDDMSIAGQRVLKGSWVMATHVSDDEVWERVRKGELGGYSIGGTGERVPLAA